jgi:hypothetical protein
MNDELEIANHLANKAAEFANTSSVRLMTDGKEVLFKFDYKGKAYSVRVKHIEGYKRIVDEKAGGVL